MSEATPDHAPGKSPYTKIVERAFAESVPLSAQFEVTYRCNHLCTFCYNSPTGQRELTTPQIFEALRKIADVGVLYLTLTGGEAMCHRDFWKIAEEARRLGMALRVYSNGYLMADPKVVERLKALNVFEVEISLHGATAETHEALTKIKGSFARTIRALENLTAAGIKINLKTPITKLNKHELRDIKKIADGLGIYVTFDAVITPKDDGDTGPLDLRADDEFFTNYWEDLYSELHGGRLPPAGNHCAADGSEANCGTGRSGFTVDPYGNILPCVALRRVAGNILEVDSLREFWQESPVLNEVRDLSVQASDMLKKRPDGRYFQFCLGVAETQLGDPLAVYPQAEINAKAIERTYELLQIEDPESRKSA